ncbi:orotidine 5'-phosphate decarboxylase [Candidatus Woesearchaeota archaeon]|nr:orotidine 5'-phosphate decarboxylase [Candidatus Woesearchaeota archaeon]
MPKTFREKWLEAVDKKNSVLCAGLDPAEFAMGRGKKGLSDKEQKRVFALRYVDAVAPYCAALKPNFQYFKDEGDVETLRFAIQHAHAMGLVVIDDSKLADIGETNDAGLYHAGKSGFDAVTVAPYAGNMAEAAKQAHERGLAAITMCLMSNPEYKREKSKQVDVCDIFQQYHPEDLLTHSGIGWHVYQYIHLARQAELSGIDGIVIGAPSAKNHITDDEIAAARRQVSDRMLVLMPGVGAQGGEASQVWKHFAPDHVIVNVGRSLMFPDGDNYAHNDEIAAKAQFYRDMLNEERKAA